MIDPELQKEDIGLETCDQGEGGGQENSLTSLLVAQLGFGRWTRDFTERTDTKSQP